MIFSTTKNDYIFILGVWIFSITFDLILCSISHDVALEQNESAVRNVLFSMYVISGAYSAITIFLLLFDILGKKFELNRKNLIAYGLRSSTILVVTFVDLVSIIATTHQFFGDVFNSEHEFPILQSVFLHGGFSITGLLSVWLLRSRKIEYKSDFD